MSEVFLRPDAGEHPGAGRRDRPARPGRREVVRTVLLVLGLFVVLGVVAGVAWWLVAPTAEFTKLRDGSGSMGDLDLGRQFDADGSYVVVAGIAGLLSGLVLMAVAIWRRGQELVVLPAMLVGSGIAALLTDHVGRLLGPGDPAEALKTAAVGSRIPDVLALHAHTAYLAWPAAVLFGSLLVLLGPERLERSEAGPSGPDPVAPVGPPSWGPPAGPAAGAPAPPGQPGPSAPGWGPPSGPPAGSSPGPGSTPPA